jgi:hypothetical protein
VFQPLDFSVRFGFLEETFLCLGLCLWLRLISIASPKAHQAFSTSASTSSILVACVLGVKPILAIPQSVSRET